MILRVLAAVTALGALLGPHLMLLLCYALAVTAVTAVGFAVAVVVAESGWGVIPVARAWPS